MSLAIRLRRDVLLRRRLTQSRGDSIKTARPSLKIEARSDGRYPRLARLVVLAFGALCVFGADAQAEGRFGDSTWVAPSMSFDAGMTENGPRVARRDQERGWETALRTPFRVVFLPLRLLGKGLEAGAAYVGPRYLEPKPNRPPKQGLALALYVAPGNPTDFGVGPSITWIGFPTANSKLQLAGSWSMSDRRRVRFSETIGDRRPVGVRLGVKYDYKPDRPYYGIGNDTQVTDLGYHRLETTEAEAALLLGASPLRQIRLAGGYSGMSPSSGYNATPLLEKAFAGTDVPFQHQTTQELWYGVSADVAALDDDRDPSRGVHGRVDLRRATGMETSAPDYTQWWVEGRAYVPVFASRRVIALRGVYTGVEPSGGSAAALPFYRLAQSENAASFAGYDSDRFRDRQLLLARAEYRWTILHGVSAIALYELGEVAPRAASFRLRDAHRSYGGGLRLGMSDDSALRFELAKSVEGLHAVLTVGSDF